MTQEDTNPPLKQHYATTYTINDPTRPQPISVSLERGNSQLAAGRLLFTFNYQPLFDTTHFEIMMDELNHNLVVRQLYNQMCLVHRTLYSEACRWLVEHFYVAQAFDIDTIIANYEAKVKTPFCCPIIQQLDPAQSDNMNVYRHFITLAKEIEAQGIQNLNLLLYGQEKFDIKAKPTYTPVAALLMQAVVNCTYASFLKFMKDKKKLNFGLKGNKLELNRSKITSKVLRTFCVLVHTSKLFLNKDNDSMKGFAQSVLTRFNLQGDPNSIRQRLYLYDEQLTKGEHQKNIGIIIEEILPRLQVQDRAVISEFLRANKMYN
jgi:hypothetical protein